VFWEEPQTAVAVVRGESSFRMVQSNYRYSATNAPAGFKEGDREQSFCMFQIHEPVHKALIKSLGLEDYRTNVESCVLMGRAIYEQAGYSFNPWTEYHKLLAMR
jgi:hypothetical protein